MRLLFDENLSPALVAMQGAEFASQHVSQIGLARSPDSSVWERARADGLTIVSKDADFHQRCLTQRGGPQVIWIRRGNCTTADVAAILRAAKDVIAAFAADGDATFLVLE